MLDKIFEVLTDSKRLRSAVLLHIAPILPDRFFLKQLFKLRVGYPLNLDNPKSFNEKLQWLKLNDHNPEYTNMVDKYEAKKYAASIIGEEHIIPTLAVYDNVDEIDISKLPDQFVLKCTHDSGGIVICKDKSDFDFDSAKRKLRKALRKNYYYQNREWPYKNVKPRIIAEKYMTDGDDELKDYKLFTFGGEPRIIEIDYNRFKGHLRSLYTKEWQKIDATIKFPTDKTKEFGRPQALDTLLNLSRKLAEGHPHIRTDFYIVDDNVYFGELTFYHGSGMEKITPLSLDLQMGEWIELPLSGGGKIIRLNNICVLIAPKRDYSDELIDYKFMCYNGVCKNLFVCTGRSKKDLRVDFFDTKWAHLPFYRKYKNADKIPDRPSELSKMVAMAETLAVSVGCAFVRVDLYQVKEHIFFGELTFFPGSGMEYFRPVEWDYKIGNLLVLPIVKE